ncbi:DUF5686 and carboxypeptidase regulatory-like domain-containing protein [Flavobacterium tegetincola]|uniref:DUF5686 and carboxypeptidase regulatory-like domain-containing protein n=1 Tax=Flavobacterium tegetincola TaxID=150172 RepID=UPI000408030F|nr:DUF5686 and carboxypeptidase regulatory-like domain-containing protein [Flavobacterium tegetincola]
MKKITTVMLLLFAIVISAQVKGTITDDQGKPIPFVSVFIENTYNGTSSNDNGSYDLNVTKPGTYTVVFQYLGYKTLKKSINPNQFPFLLNVILAEENINLAEVVINVKDNPANKVIRKAIAARKDNSDLMARFKADFYSRGIFKLKDAPKKFLGQEIGDMDGSLDSTGSGIIYLSETISKIMYEKPDNFKEKIIASKISGNDNGYSYNSARGSAFDFYKNTIPIGAKMISPIADNAFNYYKFILEGTFQDENNQMINKIKLVPRRDAEPVFEGYIYIVEDSWAIYGVDVEIKGYRAKQEFMNTMSLKQNFSYNNKNHIWSKNSQSLAFSAGAFGITFLAKFTHVFTNYEFPDEFSKKTFTNEILSFEDNANKKDSTFWNTVRPVPLTMEESKDYIKKDSLQVLHKSDKYLDSIDAKHNRFKIFDVLTGYSYKNSKKNWTLAYDGLTDLTSFSYNTVQGWNLNSGFSFTKFNEDIGTYTRLKSTFNYGFAEDRLRVVGNFIHRFNTQDYATVSVSGGSTVSQFSESEPISKLVNSVSTLFFKNNYMKLYNKEFAQIAYGQNVINGLYMSGSIGYEQRKNLFNNTDYVLIKNNDAFTSNNPLLPNDYLTPTFDTHHLLKATIGARINFGQKYISRPDRKLNIRNSKYPTINLNFEKAFAATAKNYEFEQISGRIFYNKTLGNKGNFATNIKGGKFFNADEISFIDYQHFNGNQTHIGSGSSYLNVFNLMPYYTNSTNDSYLEIHAEHNFDGYIMNKIPVLNKLNTTLIVGFHNLATADKKPYQEFTVGLDRLGFGKFKIFRVDYVRSYQNGYLGDGVLFGLKFLNVLE